MGYYAAANGRVSLHLDKATFNELAEKLESSLEPDDDIEVIFHSEYRHGYLGGLYVEDFEDMGNDEWVMYFNGEIKYHDDYIAKFLNILAPYICKEEDFNVNGIIEYSGEDGALWRHIFRNGAWYEEQGDIVYKNPTLFV